MISSIGSSQINQVNLMTALKTFKAETTKPEVNQQTVPNIAESMNTISDNILKNQNITEIQEFAKIMGENDLSQGDIKYGLQYGRSVIAEFIA